MLDARGIGGLKPFPTEETAAALIGRYDIACLLAGFFIDTFLFGVCTAMYIAYCYTKPSDRPWVRLNVACVLLMTCFLTGYNWYFCSHVFVYAFGTHAVFFETEHFSWLPPIDCVTMALTQGFFAHRAFLLCGRKYLIPISVGSFILIGFTSTIIVRVFLDKLNSLLDMHKLIAPMAVWLAATMVSDTIITGCILFGLIRSKSGIRRTNRLIGRLVRMTLESQVPATLLALALLIVLVTDATNQLSVGIMLFQSKINTIGFFYSLNARSKLATENVPVTMNDRIGVPPGPFGAEEGTDVERDAEMDALDTKANVLRGSSRPGTAGRDTTAFGEGKGSSVHLDHVEDEPSETKTQASDSAYNSTPPNSQAKIVPST